MTLRRSRGDGGLHWDARRERRIATANLGLLPDGRRNVRSASGRTKTEAKARLKEVLRDQMTGWRSPPIDFTVKDAIDDWLAHGLSGRDEATVTACTHLSASHIIPPLGTRKLRDLSAEEVDRWLAAKAQTLSTRTLQGLHSCLNRAVKRATARDKVKRNVVALCAVPTGKRGRTSKAMTLAQAQAEAVLSASAKSRMHAYIVTSLLTGARTEELRALKWSEVQLEADAVIPRTSRCGDLSGGPTTRRPRMARRTLALPQRCIDALIAHKAQQDHERVVAGERWHENDLVFASKVGTALDASHVRRDVRLAIKGVEGLDPAEWTPRELRHSFVSLLSDHGVPLEEISRLVGHSSTAVTELVYRKQLRPVIQTGAVAMDSIFESSATAATQERDD